MTINASTGIGWTERGALPPRTVQRRGPVRNAAHLRGTPERFWQRQVGPFPDASLPAFEEGVRWQTDLLRVARM